MAESELQDRLRGHAEAFDGLLSLIPAKFYYGEDTSDQWKKKKQTKEQAAAARRAKLDPESAKSAKDVMDERARKRKLEELEEDGVPSDIEGVEKELPKQGLKQPGEKKAKKQKLSSEALKAPTEEPGHTPSAADQKRQLKKERKKEQKAKRLQEVPTTKAKQKSKASANPLGEDGIVGNEHTKDTENTVMAGGEGHSGDEIGHFDAEGLEEKPNEETASPSPSPPSPVFDDPTNPSASTSTSSVIPPAKVPKHINKAKLEARIEELRNKRNPKARTRDELLEERRKKEAKERAKQQARKAKARAEEDERREAALASARDSPASSMMSPHIQSPEHNFSFGRVAFADGQQLADDLSTLLSAPKKRGPQDPATALLASEKKRQRIAGLDEEKRTDIEEKELWLNAKKRAHGEKVRDDSSLLKKTLKRKEKAKKKSEKEWTERKDGVAKSQAMRQKKREENLQKRRDEKGGKGKGKGKSVKSKKPKVKSRPGFEGSFGSGKRK
ncbi:SURF6-domain-containing protein [Stipitochalara longipes BDJ]|nr:SURF6-domain-containing protein [Stipitochalara longipes BDJ]